jgi:uncharacterized protein
MPHDPNSIKVAADALADVPADVPTDAPASATDAAGLPAAKPAAAPPADAELSGLYLHPLKSCGAVPLHDALLVETGLDLDRAWMVVDAHGEMLTQRELPRMALVQPQFKGGDLVLRAPGMLALHLALDAAESPLKVRVWDDTVEAWDMGDLAAQWFSDFLGQPARLQRFDPDQQRLSSRQWTGEIAAENAFADGFPLLVTSTASMKDLNARLAARGETAVTVQRFRPNLVFDGLQAFDEDHIDEITIAADGGTVRIKLVKPCTRCTMPDVDPATGTAGHAVGDILAGFRADPRMAGAITFGMNAVIVEGFERTLRAGQPAVARFGF